MVPSSVAQEESRTVTSADTRDRPVALTEWGNWQEWKRECALARCGPQSQIRLAQFAALHFNRWMDCYRSRMSAGAVGPVDGREAWHRLETYWLTRRGRSGKCYKDWLFARSSPGPSALPMVAGGARLLLRDVARDYIRTELAPAFTMSLDTPVRPGSTLTWNDLLPDADVSDPARAAEAHELESRAAVCAEREFKALPRPVRLAWLARELGFSIADRGLVRAARASKSALFRGLDRSVRRIATRAAVQAGGDPGAGLEISIRATRILRRRIRGWGAREKSLVPFFRRAGDTGHSVRSPRRKKR